MTETTIAPYGSWRSPITADLIVACTIGLDSIVLDGEDVYWLESRPAEGGRCVVMRRTPDGRTADLTPPPCYVRSLVHEMGGGAYTVADGTVYFVNYRDQRLYRQAPGGVPRPLTSEAPLRYADLVVDRRRGRLLTVREDHGGEGREPVNTLVGVDLGDGAQTVLASGNDFYASPRPSPDGARLTWLAWNHPNMPWDGTELWVAELDADGAIVQAQRIAGGADESIVQPEWSPDGALYFVSDRTGWWNLYRWQDGRVDCLLPWEAEFGRPQWVFGMSSYAVESAGRIVCSYTWQGCWRLGGLDTHSGTFDEIATPYTEIDSVRAAPGRAVFIGASPIEFPAIVELDLATGELAVRRRAGELGVDPAYLSPPEPIEFPTTDGETAHGLFYPPGNPGYAAPPGERPPLRVLSHGGPTSAASPSLNLAIQYWTSRGIAVLDVNYRGSTGYGRDYRRRLYDRWGVADVDDCVNGARYLVARGDVDGERLAIKGGSAGGYTTLAALAFRDVFKAGASYYGISDLEALARDTHKFESRYLDRLIGPYPERRDLYVERSPIHAVDRLACPVIFLQGLEDRIVPPNQAKQMVQALRAKGLPVAYVPFAGEQHGFRRAENIKRALEAELYFYSRVFGFALADPVEPVPIENLR